MNALLGCALNIESVLGECWDFGVAKVLAYQYTNAKCDGTEEGKRDNCSGLTSSESSF